MNWLDWVLIIIIILSALRGLNTGFFVGISRIIGLILGIAVAFTCYRSLADYLHKQWGWGNSIADFILNHLSFSFLQDLIGKMPITSYQTIPGDQIQSIPESLNNIAHQLAMTILEFLSFIALLILVALVVKMIMRFTSGAIAHTFLSPLDHFGGLILGLARGVIIVLVMALLLEPVLAAGVIANHEKAGFISQAANGSIIIPYAWQLLNIVDIHLPLWQSSIVLHGING
ncbi:CvpA family protein [Desulfoscipio gibsoniae]|uniref:Putative membrane protein, required for colicin V production n=1 Tax=Desulfoscipio gibsoniae DSM 7213 TaxID=767817 RepID=R4KTP0_9FIRM|nr:CvpA family protein [Desulfoscipio gibsoniae]AGL03970.1 putative membrane protein, required for colicin V production [Desulfoscipio gibsoniae DSM 7213]